MLVRHACLANHCQSQEGLHPWRLGGCDGEYTHATCKNVTCDCGTDHYDHDKMVHYYHVCHEHTTKDRHNGKCPTTCAYRQFVDVVIDGVHQR